MHEIDLADVYKCFDRSLDLFDRTYSSAAPNAGGWYHRLDSNTQGPSATAVALHSYLLIERVPRQLTEGLAFLKSRQIVSDDPLLGGGWPVNTSAGQPLLESTSLVVRLLGFGHLMIGSESPDASAAYQWIIRNQNTDGGWGPFLGQPSRIWLTAMAIRAIVEINLNDPSVVSGVEWLLRERDPATAAWGERPRGSATVTHTSFVLTALIESRLGRRRPHADEAVRKGFDWLQRHVDPSSLFDDEARVESYNVSYVKDSRTVTWQNSVWHPGLPYVLAALVRHPHGADPSLVAGTVRKIVSSQTQDGRWPNSDGAAGISVWSVWPFLDALADFTRKTPVRATDRVTWLDANSVVIRRGPAASRSLARIMWGPGISRIKALSRRHWATAMLCATVAVAAVLTVVGVLGLKDSALAIILPVLLVAIQEILARGRSAARS